VTELLAIFQIQTLSPVRARVRVRVRARVMARVGDRDRVSINAINIYLLPLHLSSLTITLALILTPTLTLTLILAPTLTITLIPTPIMTPTLTLTLTLTPALKKTRLPGPPIDPNDPGSFKNDPRPHEILILFLEQLLRTDFFNFSLSRLGSFFIFRVRVIFRVRIRVKVKTDSFNLMLSRLVALTLKQTPTLTLSLTF
jgi:hypothetical protein